MAHDLELWLVRHGESEFGAQRRIAGWADPPLSTLGEQQAEALRPFLDGHSFTSAWSSDLNRAITTARLAWGEVPSDRRLREISFGSLEGLSFDAIDLPLAKQLLEFREFAAPDGESIEQVRSRAHEFVAQLEPGRHLLFVHGGIIRLFSQDLGVDRFVPTGTVVGIDWQQQQLLFVHPATDDQAIYPGVPVPAE